MRRCSSGSFLSLTAVQDMRVALPGGASGALKARLQSRVLIGEADRHMQDGVWL
jgi:hypothetical protein